MKQEINDSNYTFIDLFCGIGGFSNGFINAGFKHLFGVDNWNLACDVYKVNIGDVYNIDIENFYSNIDKYITKQIPDIIIGSPPCQSFSSANTSDRQCDISLSRIFMDIVNKIKPKVWVMENVPEIKDYFDCGYRYVFDMSEYGLLQKRERFIASNIPIHIDKPKNKFYNIDQTEHIIKFRPEAIHKKYQTITCRYNSFGGTNPAITDNKKIRTLNHEEALAIQTFPYYYKIPDYTQRNIETLIGNSVPPAFAYKLGNHIKNYLYGNHKNNVIKSDNILVI